MKHCALIGHPLGHSLSPEIHQRLFSLGEIDATYTLDAIPPERFLDELPRVLEYDAFNVTIPYKRDILPHLDALTPEAELYGAVNCVHREADGRLIGGNTDCGGFLRTMTENGVALDTRVCVLGAGGVGRMFAIECARQGGEVTVAVRQHGEKGGNGKAEALRDEIRRLFSREISVCDICEPDIGEHPFELVINATPVGMFPNIGASPVPSEFLRGAKTVFDCIYNPTETLLLRQAREAGCEKILGGMPMLVYQAALAQEQWFGARFKPAALAALISEMEGRLGHE